MRALITHALALLFTSILLATAAHGAPNLQTISVAESNALIESHKSNANFVILDVRTPGEYAQGHLKQSQLLDFRAEGFEEKLNTLDKSKSYLIYCRSGGRSGMALKLMEKQGFQSVYNMDGGFNEWSRAEFPFEK